MVLQKQTNKSEHSKTISSAAADKFMKHFDIFYGDDDENCTTDNPPHQAAHVKMANGRVRATSIDATKLINANAEQTSDDESTLENEKKRVFITGATKRNFDDMNIDDDSSSSSGKEALDEKTLSSSGTLAKSSKSSTPSPKKKPITHYDLNNKPEVEKVSNTSSSTPQNTNNGPLPANWWCPEIITLDKVRDRYFFSNGDFASKMLGDSLRERLDMKVKQNWGLLSTLPDFVVNATVRKITSSHLEKWLQSPALSGLARNLLSAVVENIGNAGVGYPPLEEDVETISNILSMKLKSNQVRIVCNCL